jgi:hypothetical protein
MEIRAEQMNALSQMRRAMFLRRLRQFIEEHTQQVPEEGALADLFERGERYGLVSEQQFAGYVMLSWQSGVRPPAPDPTWMAEVMNDPARSADAKVDAIYDRARAIAEGKA